jgi:hypothetical protein
VVLESFKLEIRNWKLGLHAFPLIQEIRRAIPFASSRISGIPYMSCMHCGVVAWSELKSIDTPPQKPYM